MLPPTWIYTVQHDDLRGLVPFLSLPSHPTQNATYLFHHHQIYHTFYLHSFLGSCHPCVLMQTLVLEVCVTYTYPPFSTELHHSSFIIFFTWNFKIPAIPALTLSPIRLFRFSRMHNLFFPFPNLFTILSNSFQNHSLSSPFHSLGPYPTIPQTLTLENLNLIRRILELKQPMSVIAIYHIIPRAELQTFPFINLHHSPCFPCICCQTFIHCINPTFSRWTH